MSMRRWTRVAVAAFVVTGCAANDTYQGLEEAIDPALAGRSGFVAGRCPDIAGTYANAGKAVGPDGKDVQLTCVRNV